MTRSAARLALSLTIVVRHRLALRTRWTDFNSHARVHRPPEYPPGASGVIPCALQRHVSCCGARVGCDRRVLRPDGARMPSVVGRPYALRSQLANRAIANFAQIDSTPFQPRCSSIHGITASVGGCAQPAQKTPSPCRGSRWHASIRGTRARIPAAAEYRCPLDRAVQHFHAWRARPSWVTSRRFSRSSLRSSPSLPTASCVHPVLQYQKNGPIARTR